MKLTIGSAIVFSLIVLCPTAALAESPVPAVASLQGEELLSNLAAYTQMDILLGRGIFLSEQGIPALQAISLTLDPFYKQVLYDRYARNPWPAATLNLLTGGLGSLLMNDVWAGVILETGMTFSYAVAIYGLADPKFRSVGGYTWGEVGAIVFGVAGIVWPFLSSLPWNSKLKRSLNM